MLPKYKSLQYPFYTAIDLFVIDLFVLHLFAIHTYKNECPFSVFPHPKYLTTVAPTSDNVFLCPK